MSAQIYILKNKKHCIFCTRTSTHADHPAALLTPLIQTLIG